MKTTRKSLMDRIKVVVLATSLSVLPAKEVNSGISYGGSVGVDFNGNVSIGGQILSVNNPNSVYGKLGANLILMGKDKGGVSFRGGVGYLFDKGVSLGVEGGYNRNSESPFSLGVGVGYGKVKKDGENGDGIGGCQLIEEGDWGDEEICKERCITTGGIWGDESDETGNKCECPEGKGLGVGGSCNIRG